MSHASNGRRREWTVRDAMLGHGWELIARAAGSKGPADLIVAHPDHGVALVQVGSASKTLGPTDRARLLHAAHLCSALPVLAVVVPRAPIAWWLVSDATPGKWTGWQP